MPEHVGDRLGDGPVGGHLDGCGQAVQALGRKVQGDRQRRGVIPPRYPSRGRGSEHASDTTGEVSPPGVSLEPGIDFEALPHGIGHRHGRRLGYRLWRGAGHFRRALTTAWATPVVLAEFARDRRSSATASQLEVLCTWLGVENRRPDSAPACHRSATWDRAKETAECARYPSAGPA